jgi:tetratricopeptide (TPR) repeat protein
MFSEKDEKYLLRHLGRNETILFLGSGFSRDAKNQLGESFPTGNALGEKLWEFIGYSGEYDGTSLQEMYQAFTGVGVKRNKKIEFLNNNLLSGEIPEEYDYISKPFWYKIYTLNIDDILEKVYRRESKKTQELIYPNDEFRERDQSLEKSQVVYLHGKLPCNPEEVIFSTKQYAKASLSNQPLYSQFVFDYATHPTIFVGTDLNEPLFERYIESREGKGGYAELRPKSFIITPKLSPVKADILKNEYNVHHVAGTTEDFLQWLKSIHSQLPERNEILKSTFPNLLSVLEFADLTNVPKFSIKEFASSFKRVPTEYRVKDIRSGFLLGTNPRWNDIFKNLDIPRTLTSHLFNLINDRIIGKTDISKQLVYSIDGYAGAGKSTIIKRLGLTLSQNGITVFTSDSDYIPRVDYIVDVLTAVKERVVLIFDNAKNVIPQLDKLVKAFSVLDFPPIIVLALRSNQMDRLKYIANPDIIEHQHFQIEDLDDDEINSLIAKLEENNLLGLLKGMPSYRRFKEFKYRAKKQILVAMKEATQGKSFNEIISNEFNDITPPEAKLLCLCVALNTELGFTNTKQDFIGFSNVSHSEALSYLQTNLNGIIMWTNDSNRFMLRHRILADYMIKHCANLAMLKSAYIRVLSILSPELKKSQGNSRKFNLYKSLINHRILYSRFKNDIEQAREVFDSLTSYFDDDAHFWLQYGCLELEGKGGDFDLAENYIKQAESLAPKYSYIQNAKCLLYYKLSSSISDYSHALDYKQKADELATNLLATFGRDDPHVAHIHCKGEYEFINRWVTEKGEKTTKLKELKTIVEGAVRMHPRDRKLDIASQAITRAYLQQGADIELPNPEIPE